MSCSYMISALIVGTEKMNIVQMDRDVITTFAFVGDIEQHSCNTAQDHKFKSFFLTI